MALAWLYDQELLDDHIGMELSLEWGLCRFWAISKCQFGDTVDETTQCAILRRLLPWEDKLMAIQTGIGWV